MVGLFLVDPCNELHGHVTSYYTKEGSGICLFVTSEYFENLKSKNFYRFFGPPKKVEFFEIFRAGKKSRLFRDYVDFWIFFWLYDFFGFYDISSKISIFSIFLIGFVEILAVRSPRLRIHLGYFLAWFPSTFCLECV